MLATAVAVFAPGDNSGRRASASAPTSAPTVATGDDLAARWAATSSIEIQTFAPTTSAGSTTTVAPAATASPSAVSIPQLASGGIPVVALAAYQYAALRYATVAPGCGVHWTLLAAIGRVESDHGRFGGASLAADGSSTPHIIGPALNGVGTALIPATPFGVTLDADPVYDHAVGPMQFIPSTWLLYGIPASGHPTADPFNIGDAALTAARYLCAAGGDLTTAAGQQQAVFAYNHSDSYVATVLALETAYANGNPLLAAPAPGAASSEPSSAPMLPPANAGAPPALTSAPAAPTPTPTTATPSGPTSATPTPTPVTTSTAANCAPTPTATPTTDAADASPTPSTAPPSSAAIPSADPTPDAGGTAPVGC